MNKPRPRLAAVAKNEHLEKQKQDAMAGAMQGLQQTEDAQGTPTKRPVDYKRDYITTTINMPRNLHRLLQAAAMARQAQYGGRASVSDLVVEMLSKNAGEIEQWAAQYGALLPSSKPEQG